jgi:hypothetical protein
MTEDDDLKKDDELKSSNFQEAELMRQVRALAVIKAPASLREKLVTIPHDFPRTARTPGVRHLYRRIASFGLAAAAVILVYSYFPIYNESIDNEVVSNDRIQNEKYYSQAELLAAKQELAVAFHYLGEVSQHTAHNVNTRVTGSSKYAIYKGIFYPMIEDKNDEQNIK